VPEREELDKAGIHSSYRAWLTRTPEPGEVFVDTGEASAVDARKLRWSPTKEQRAKLLQLMKDQMQAVNTLFDQGKAESYGARLSGLVGKTLHDAGVEDPAKFGVSAPEAAQGESKGSASGESH
jgi:hypothetical protein